MKEFFEKINFDNRRHKNHEKLPSMQRIIIILQPVTTSELQNKKNAEKQYFQTLVNILFVKILFEKKKCLTVKILGKYALVH